MQANSRPRIRVLDTHTGGEPTRVVLAGGPDLGTGSLTERRDRFRRDHDLFRSAVVNEPRGSDVMVGALLCPPSDPTCATGVIFFNNVGYLGMCGHGTIGVVVALAHLGRLSIGTHRLETPAGIVTATLHPDQTVSVTNVPSYRTHKHIAIDVPGLGPITGDIAWGGNWFFLTDAAGRELRIENVDVLTDYSWRLRQAVNHQGFPQVDHVELFGPPILPGSNARNFVLCPGKAYDRSPCGTGTSAKLACLADDGHWPESKTWVQEGILGTTFTGYYSPYPAGGILPTISGTAFVNAETTLLLDPLDPFCYGIRP
jgi:4-hydroxyproline epimerase